MIDEGVAEQLTGDAALCSNRAVASCNVRGRVVALVSA